MIRYAELKDLDEWLSLAAEVEDLFGPMVTEPDFIKALEKSINEKKAIGIENEAKVPVGFVIVSKRKNEIAWLAVKKEERGKGYGHELLKRALEELNPASPIYVQTFAPGINAGEGARKLYLEYGFKDLREGGKNPAGIDTVIMVR